MLSNFRHCIYLVRPLTSLFYMGNLQFPTPDVKKKGKGGEPADVNPIAPLSRAEQAAKDDNQFVMRPILCTGWLQNTCRAVIARPKRNKYANWKMIG